MARTIDPIQRNNTLVLMVKDFPLWSAVRQFCIDRNVPLSQFVSDAVKAHLERLRVHAEAIENVRQPNG